MLCWQKCNHGRGRGAWSLTSTALQSSCCATFGTSPQPSLTFPPPLFKSHLIDLRIFYYYFGVRLSLLQACNVPTATRLWTQLVPPKNESQQNPVADEKLLDSQGGLGAGEAPLLTETHSLWCGDEAKPDAEEERATPVTRRTTCFLQGHKRKSNEERERNTKAMVCGWRWGREEQWFSGEGRCYFSQTGLISALM